MKTHEKKKAFQRFCRDQVFKGQINQADGTWHNANSNKSMDASMQAGYRVGSKRK